MRSARLAPPDVARPQWAELAATVPNVPSHGPLAASKTLVSSLPETTPETYMRSPWVAPPEVARPQWAELAHTVE